MVPTVIHLMKISREISFGADEKAEPSDTDPLIRLFKKKKKIHNQRSYQFHGLFRREKRIGERKYYVLRWFT